MASQLDAFQNDAWQTEIAIAGFSFQSCAFADDAFEAEICGVVSTTRLKYWNGVGWSEKVLKYWDGNSYQTKTLKAFVGGSWIN